jgi:hypothetical protein
LFLLSLASLLAVLAILLFPAVVFAHAEPTASTPAPEETLKEAPTSVTITFSQTVNPNGSDIIVYDPVDVGLMSPAIDASGNMWVGAMAKNLVMVSAIDTRGNVWFAEQGAGYIGRLDPQTGQTSQFPIQTADGERQGRRRSGSIEPAASGSAYPMVAGLVVSTPRPGRSAPTACQSVHQASR